MMGNRYITALPAIGVTFASQVDFQFDRPGGEHSHDELQVLVVVSGSFILGIGQETHPLAPGDIAVLRPRVRHVVPATADRALVSLLDLRFALEHRGDLTAALKAQAWPVVLHASPHESLALARELEDAVNTGHASAAALTRAFWSLIVMLQRALATATEPQTDHRIALTERFMLQHLREPLTAEQIAAACELSVSQLNRIYREQRGAGPVARLRQLRVDRARELLATTLLSVKEISRECGFVCANHFCRAFKDEVTLTPGDYRIRAASKGIRLGSSARG